MSAPKIVTITNPVDKILAQLQEIREGNAREREKITHAQANLKGAAKEEARLEKQLEKLLAKARAKRLDNYNDGTI